MAVIKKILKEWCIETGTPYEAAKKARERVNVGVREFGRIYLTKKEFDILKNDMIGKGKRGKV
jgi:hypothetical protein